MGACSVHMIHGRSEYRYLSKVWHELLGLFILWVMWLVGAAIATVSANEFAHICVAFLYLVYSHPQSIWPNLPSICSQFSACNLLDAMLAFAWLGWLTIFALVVTTLMYATANSSWSEPAHGHWVREDPRASSYSQYSVTQRA